MQAGTTGIKTIRMYYPIKQSKEHDPDGIFIKKWLPELKNVPLQFIHELYKMSLLEQQFYNFYINKNYPEPIINIESAGKEARKNIWGHRNNELVQQVCKRILFTHTRHKNK